VFTKAAETLSERSLEQIEDVEIRETRAIALGVVVVISPMHSLISSHISPQPFRLSEAGEIKTEARCRSAACGLGRRRIEARKNVFSH
jgi:hypothetical protein